MIKDIFKTKQYKADIQSLQERCAELEKYVTPEMQNAISLEKRIKELSELSTQYEKNIQELVLGYNQIDATRKSLFTIQKRIKISSVESNFQMRN
ncbi:MAG: hypothetical protein PUD90_09680 [Clostridia bacterium]|nr:hypothetical protein [Clostridia bacterium]